MNDFYKHNTTGEVVQLIQTRTSDVVLIGKGDDLWQGGNIWQVSIEEFKNTYKLVDIPKYQRRID